MAPPLDRTATLAPRHAAPRAEEPARFSVPLAEMPLEPTVTLREPALEGRVWLPVRLKSPEA